METKMLMLSSLGFAGLITMLIGWLYKAIPSNKAKKCTVETVGHVVDYYYRGEMRIGPVVEFSGKNGIVHFERTQIKDYEWRHRM